MIFETHHVVPDVTHPHRLRKNFAFFFGFSATFAK